MKTVDVIDNSKGLYSVYDVSSSCRLSVRSIQRYTKFLVSLGSEYAPEFEGFCNGSFYTKEQREFLNFFCNLKKAKVPNWKCLEQWNIKKNKPAFNVDQLTNWAASWLYNEFGNKELSIKFKEEYNEYLKNCN